jgi:hypothetical protein
MIKITEGKLRPLSLMQISSGIPFVTMRLSPQNGVKQEPFGVGSPAVHWQVNADHRCGVSRKVTRDINGGGSHAQTTIVDSKCGMQYGNDSPVDDSAMGVREDCLH